MTFQDARAKYVVPVTRFGGEANWPEGYTDDESVDAWYMGSVGGVGVFRIRTHGGLRVDLWTRTNGMWSRAQLTVPEAHALSTLLGDA